MEVNVSHYAHYTHKKKKKTLYSRDEYFVDEIHWNKSNSWHNGNRIKLNECYKIP